MKKVQVIEKNEGAKVQWEQSGKNGEFLQFADGELTIKVPAYQQDQERTVDICADRGGCLVIGAAAGIRYVAQVVIPAATYTEHTEGEGEEQITTREKNPLDMADVKLVLWSIE